MYSLRQQLSVVVVGGCGIWGSSCDFGGGFGGGDGLLISLPSVMLVVMLVAKEVLMAVVKGVKGPVHTNGFFAAFQTTAVALQCKTMELFKHNRHRSSSGRGPSSNAAIYMPFNGKLHTWWFEGCVKATLPFH